MTCTSLFVYFILCVFPLLITKTRYDQITYDKFFFFLVAVVLLVLGTVAERIYAKFKNKQIQKPNKINVSHILLALYLLWNIISGLKSQYGKDVIVGQARYEGLLSLFLYATAFYVVSLKGKSETAMVRGIAVASLIMGAVALIQQKGSSLFYPENWNYEGSRFISTVGHEDIYAGFVSIFVPILFVNLLIDESKWKYMNIPGLILLFISAVKSGVETAKFGILIPVAFSIPYVISHLVCKYCKKLKSKKKAIQTALAILLVIALIVVILFVYKYDGDNQTIKEASEILHGNLADKAGHGRGRIWKHAMEIAKENPIFGTGPGTFCSENLAYKDRYDSVVTDLAHNDFLQIASCTGFVGLALYVVFLLSVFIQGIRKNTNATITLMCGALGFIVYSAFVFSIVIISPLFWVLVGLIVSEFPF